MNTGLFEEQPVVWWREVLANIGSFFTQIEPLISQLLARFLAANQQLSDALETSYPKI